MKKQKMNKGITLIALIITIIVLLILAVVAISAVKGDGIIAHAKNAKSQYSGARDNELTMLQNYEKRLDEEQFKIEITVGEKKVILTKDNVADYLGKKVTNYIGETSVTIDSNTYTVSPTYRLYYVDFDNKYGDGAGTIYLKADCTSNKYAVLTTDTTAATEPNIKIKKLNPELYKEGVTAPSKDNANMKAVTWLTNTTNWEDLKTSDETLASKVNYVVGAPSLEMMMDSYNTHYKLTGETPKVGTIAEGERTKLFYRYTTNTYGYEVGPNSTDEYSSFTTANSVCTDEKIDTMYYPGQDQCYWLASPAANLAKTVTTTLAVSDNGSIGGNSNWYLRQICPLVSLKSSADLTLEE